MASGLVSSPPVTDIDLELSERSLVLLVGVFGVVDIIPLVPSSALLLLLPPIWLVLAIYWSAYKLVVVSLTLLAPRRCWDRRCLVSADLILKTG